MPSYTENRNHSSSLTTLLQNKFISFAVYISTRIATCDNMLHKPISTTINMLPQLALRKVLRATAIIFVFLSMKMDFNTINFTFLPVLSTILLIL